VERLTIPVLSPRSSLPGDPGDDDWTAHHRQLRQLARQVDRGESPSHEIAVDLWRGHARERLWLRVASVRRGNYSQWEFVGPLDQQSALWPYLRPGMSLSVQQYEIQAIRPASEVAGP
jgi:hypothetical protein